ncbi:hypothetical protein SAMN05428995_101571 [Loktanella sp. DSM 29012]|uniref:hypothetical protein n=1 Tax=Loktanella sp. DSM 29012 TaxID=1881056 RepID=UPI0008B72556|nr:hypothetical protein [Loktanella sp. DSM 29012]SEP70926.1 hypothetical protein SAMN05428995_101571 [Loktanella sp. DSM 29012]
MSQSPLDIVFHIGAHKTATTHLQHSIGNVSDKLAEAGIQFFGPQSLRQPGKRLEARFNLPFNPRKSNADPRPSDVVLDEMVQGGHRLLLSEENYIGVLFDRSTDGPMHRIAAPLYPTAGERLMALAHKIAPQGIDVCLGVREPAGFLNSAYGQAFLAGHFIHVNKFKQQNPLSLVDWADLVARLRMTPGVRNITVWRQEDYHLCTDQILRVMLGDAARHVVPIRRLVNPGLSQAAVQHVLDMRSAGHDGPLAHLARAEFPIGPTRPAYQAYDREERALSSEFYQAQIAALDLMDGVTLLRPQG